MLRDLKTLFENENRWTRRALARSITGIAVNPCAPEAACWCLSGALQLLRIRYRDSKCCDEVQRALEKVAVAIYGHSDLAHINDCYGYKEVMTMVSRALNFSEELTKLA